MDISPLEKLGKVAGVPGIAVGGFVLVAGAVLAATDTLPASWRGPVVVLVVLGAAVLGLLAVFGWMRGARAGAQVARTQGDESAARNEDATKTGGRQNASTRGKHSPASNIRK